MLAVGGDGYAPWPIETFVFVVKGDFVGSKVDAADFGFSVAVGEEGEGGVRGNGHTLWAADPFLGVREGDLVGAEIDVTNAVFIVVCNEGEGGVERDVNALWAFKPFVGACDCVGVGNDVVDSLVTIIDDEEEVVVGA